jgi:putative transposase
MMDFTEIHPSYRISDEVWQRISWAIPPELPKPKGGRPRMDNRQALDAIFYVLRTGCQWKALPRSLGASSTVHDRYQEWADQGVFERMWELGLEEYARKVGIDWDWMSMDGAMVKAPLGGEATGANPTDRAKSGTKRSVLTDGRGIPLAVAIEGANRHDMKLSEPTLEAQRMVPSDTEVRNLCLNKGYDYDEVREIVKAWGYVGHIPFRDERKQIIHDIPNYRARRWVVERTHSWMNRFRRLLVRWEKYKENYLGMIHLACACIAIRAIQVFG